MQTEMLMYKDFVDEMFKQGWVYVDGVSPHTLTHHDTGIVSTFHVKKGMIGTVLEIKCPMHRNLSVCGLNHSGIDIKEFVKFPMLYSTPYFFSIRCKGNDGQELSPYTGIKIIQYDSDNLPKWSRTEFYGDLSQSIGERFKRKHERYYFPQGIILYSGEKLGFKVHELDIEVVKTELLMKADIWVKGNL